MLVRYLDNTSGALSDCNERKHYMKSNKKETFSGRIILYPIVIFAVGILVSIFVPMWSNSIDPRRFGHSVGHLTVEAIILAFVVGLIFDLRRKKANQKMKGDTAAHHSTS